MWLRADAPRGTPPPNTRRVPLPEDPRSSRCHRIADRGIGSRAGVHVLVHAALAATRERLQRVLAAGLRRNPGAAAHIPRRPVDRASPAPQRALYRRPRDVLQAKGTRRLAAASRAT